MNAKKTVLLFAALLVPSLIFIFLKMFGKNQFDVEVLFTESLPSFATECGVVHSVPYHIPDSIRSAAFQPADSLLAVYFGNPDDSFVNRVADQFENEPLGWRIYTVDRKGTTGRCIYFLREPFDVALVDTKGRIRGQYNSLDRDDVDRLITETAILLKKY